MVQILFHLKKNSFEFYKIYCLKANRRLTCTCFVFDMRKNWYVINPYAQAHQIANKDLFNSTVQDRVVFIKVPIF